MITNRRDVLALGGACAALAGGGAAFAALPGEPVARLETRLFNFKSDVASNQEADVISHFRAAAATAGLDGFMLGRNLNTQPFPTRFEWIYMAQSGPTGLPRPGTAIAEFETAQDELATFCRDQAICDLRCPLPEGYGAAPRVGVRHTVMFSFKPDATAEDRSRNVSAIRAMGKLPMVRNYLVEPRDPSASGPDLMEWQVIGDFASEADFHAYVGAPVHLAIRQDFTAYTSRVAFLDVRL